MDPVVPSAVKAFLEGRDWPCAKCQYNLRGAAGPYCPECGETISMVRPARFTNAEEAFLAGLGFSILAAVVWVVAIFASAKDALVFLALVIPAAMVAATCVIWCIWISVLKRVARSNPAMAAGNTIAAWAVGIVGLLILLRAAVG